MIFFCSYLTDRRQLFSIHNSNSSLKPINVGVFQGSTLVPLHFLFYVNDLPNFIESVPRLFADDTCLLVGAPTINQLEKQLNLELTEICNWMVANKLILNASKSHALIISPKRRSHSERVSLQCPAGRINTVKKAKYLGIISNNQINFVDHIKNTETKVACSVGILSKLSYYLPNSAMLQLHYSLVHPNLLCGVEFGVVRFLPISLH